MQAGLDEAWIRLVDLLNGRDGEERGDQLPGAELRVTEDGSEVFHAALGRHARREGAIFWIRPIVARETDSATGLPEFDLQVNRRRALDVLDARVDGLWLELTLATGQVAAIRPASGPQLAMLADFDSWLATLPARTTARIDQIEDDSEVA